LRDAQLRKRNSLAQQKRGEQSENKTVQEQAATIARLQKQIEALTAGLQKVSAQLELSKSVPQTVVNNQ
jgi:uncharacterized coiled-coil protein SlyX